MPKTAISVGQRWLCRLGLLLAFVLSPLPGRAQCSSALGETDRTRLAEAFRIADQIAGQVWPEWNKVSFAVLLITPDSEYLIRHPHPSSDFVRVGHDDRLGGDVYCRKRVFDTHLLATFPAVNGIPTTVVGQAEVTDAKNSMAWVITLLHEYFHQWQTFQTGYYAATEGLGLARGDTTGMWMLNYPFPYDRADLNVSFAALGRLLRDALEAPPARFMDRLHAYRRARRQFAALLAPDDYKYFAFQLWQEGVARFTELQVAELAAKQYLASQEFRTLQDFTPFDRMASGLREKILSELSDLRLKENQRIAFYAFGAGEALLLDRTNPGWRGQYLDARFSLEALLMGKPVPRKRAEKPERSS